jgi:membrane protein
MGVLRFLYTLWLRFESHDGWAIASHMALSTLMAIFPFLIFVAALAGVVGLPSLQAEIVRLLFESWPRGVAEPIAEEVGKVLGNARPGLVTISAVIAFVLASNGVEAVRTGVNRANGVRETRPFWFNRLQSLFFVIVAALALLTLAVLVVLWPVIWSQTVALVPAVAELAPLISAGRYAMTFLILGGAILLIHLYLAAGRQELRTVWPGAALTFLLWLAGGAVFATYLKDFATYSRTYAGLASVVAALFFLWLVAVAFLIGAEFNALLKQMRKQAVPSDGL